MPADHLPDRLIEQVNVESAGDVKREGLVRRFFADIRSLGVLAEKLDAPASAKLIQHFLNYTPFKLKVATPEASYGAFLNFYVCAVNFILPDGTETPFRSTRRSAAT